MNTKKSIWALLAFILINNISYAQQKKNFLFQNVYVWTFTELKDSPQKQVTPFTRDLANIFEEALVNYPGSIVLERTRYGEIETRIEQEEVLGNVNKDDFFREARMVVFGELKTFSDPDGGEGFHELTLRFTELYEKRLEHIKTIQFKVEKYSSNSDSRANLRKLIGDILPEINDEYLRKKDSSNTITILGSIENNYQQSIDVRVPQVPGIRISSDEWGLFRIELDKDKVRIGQEITLEFKGEGLRLDTVLRISTENPINLNKKIKLNVSAQIRFKGRAQVEKGAGYKGMEKYDFLITSDPDLLKPVPHIIERKDRDEFSFILEAKDILKHKYLYIYFFPQDSSKYKPVSKISRSVDGLIRTVIAEGKNTIDLDRITFQKKSFELPLNIFSTNLNVHLDSKDEIFGPDPAVGISFAYKRKITSDFPLFLGASLKYLSFKDGTTYKVFSKELNEDLMSKNLYLGLVLNYPWLSSKNYFSYAEIAFGNRLYTHQQFGNFINDSAFTLFSKFSPNIEAKVGGARYLNSNRTVALTLELGYAYYVLLKPDITFDPHGNASVTTESKADEFQSFLINIGFSMQWPVKK